MRPRRSAQPQRGCQKPPQCALHARMHDYHGQLGNLLHRWKTLACGDELHREMGFGVS
jgi:hypothetical protein